jgi:hypothetical protein
MRIRIQIQGFDDFTAEKNVYFFISKIAFSLYLGLHKGRQSYRSSLHSSKENI